MKARALSAVMFLGISFSASSQLLLNPGDNYTHSFSQVPFIGTGPVNCGYWSEVALGLTPATFNEGDIFQIDLRALNGTLIHSGTISYPRQPPDISFLGNGAFQVPGGYSGEVRVTMLSGSATLETIGLTFVLPRCDEPGVAPAHIYGAVVAVPEPSVTFLSAAFLLGVIGRGVLQRRLR